MVLHTYAKRVFAAPMRFVANSCEGSRLQKLWAAVSGYLKCEWLLTCDKNIKIVHVHTASYNSFRRSAWFVKQAKRHGRKVVCHVHGGAFKEYRFSHPHFVDGILRRCDAVVTLSASWQRYFQGELDLNNVVVVNNVIDYPTLMQVEGDGKFHLLFLGWINEEKGVFELLECLAEHAAEWQGMLMLHVAGKGEVARLEQEIKRMKLDGMVKFEGWVSGEQKAQLLNQADAYILPSHIEGLPISILEAMSYGLPILATPVGGIPEVVADSVNGFLFSPNDIERMTAGINRLMNSASLCKTMGEVNKAVAAEYMPDAVAERLTELYHSLL